MYRLLAVVIVGLSSMTVDAAERVKKFDIDKDLHVNYVELVSKCKVSKQLFELADKDNDNVLSEAEMRTARAYLFSDCQKEIKKS